ncbi:hypothetical protein [Microvirga ossetica]|uniref:hypothetical protein n=1 Tax=Microvirga ossetica TaxID=1882682 RepID=UPI0013000E5B|nr:hypothetical protein [Microvirga ossetica]
MSEAPEEAPGETPSAWFYLAHAYLYDAATLSAAPKPAGGHYEAPVRYLYFHAIELFLKAYLRLKGIEEKKLKYSPYGHNLNSLANEAEKLGLFIGKRVRLVCDATDDFDDPLDARYIKTGRRRALLTYKLHEAARDLQSRVEQSLNAAGIMTLRLPKLPLVHPPRPLTVAKARKMLMRKWMA